MQFHNTFISHSQAESLVFIGSDYSVMFDGINDHADISDSGKHLQYTEAEFDAHGLTVNLWVKFDAFSGSEPLYCIGRNHNQYYGYGFQIGNNQKAQIHMYGLNGTASGGGSNNRKTRQTTTTLNTGQWYMLTFVIGSHDRADWKIYFNGVNQSASNSGNNNVTLTYNNTTNALIGRSGRTSGERYHAGNISSLASWEDVLDATQIASLYNSGQGLDPTVDSSYGGTDSSGNLRNFFRFEQNGQDTEVNASVSFTGTVFETDVP